MPLSAFHPISTHLTEVSLRSRLEKPEKPPKSFSPALNFATVFRREMNTEIFYLKIEEDYCDDSFSYVLSILVLLICQKCYLSFCKVRFVCNSIVSNNQKNNMQIFWNVSFISSLMVALGMCPNFLWNWDSSYVKDHVYWHKCLPHWYLLQTSIF